MRKVITGVLAGPALIAALLFLPWGHDPVQTQTRITSTTLSAAVAANDGSIPLTSDSGVAAGTYFYVDTELMQAISEIGTSSRWNVRRGLGNGKTGQVAHATGSRVWLGSGDSFKTVDAGGVCTTELYSPWINTKNGRMWECEASTWMQWSSDPVFVREFTVRDSFDQGYLVMQDDGTVKSLTDAEENFVYGSPLGAIEYREEQNKTASSWITINGYLEIAGDSATSAEGVEIIVGASSDAALNQYIEAGTQGACMAASLYIADVSAVGQFLIGFRQNEAFQDAAAYAGYTVWSALGVTATDGSITSKEEVSSSTTTDDTGVDWADGETRALKVCVSKGGVPTAFYTDAYTTSQSMTDRPVWKPITMTNSGVTYTAGVGMIPYISFLISGTDGVDSARVNWVELTRLP